MEWIDSNCINWGMTPFLTRDPEVFELGDYIFIPGVRQAVLENRETITAYAVKPDGTILVTGKKVYLQDENGEPDGAGLCDVWITPDGKIVRKSKPVKING